MVHSSHHHDSINQDDTSLSQTKLKPNQNLYFQLQACKISSWYPIFSDLSRSQNNPIDNDPRSNTVKSNSQPQDVLISNSNKNLYLNKYKNVTIKSVIIKQLPFEFIRYLHSDGLVLPTEATKVSSFLPEDLHQTNNCNYQKDNDDDWSSSSEEDSNQSSTNKNYDNDDNISSEFSFPELTREILSGIQTLKGCVVPKFNLSVPKDATWINSGTLKCSTPGDIYLLLKSSDFVCFELDHSLENADDDCVGGDDCDKPKENMIERYERSQCECQLENNDNHQLYPEFELVLRKWCNLHPSMEFRCFVFGLSLVAISQRNHTQYYAHLNKDYMMIRSDIIHFYENIVRDNFGRDVDIPNYVFDVYIDKNQRVWLIDFNIWGNQTDSLLFTWDELESFGRGEFKNIISGSFGFNSDHSHAENTQDEKNHETTVDSVLSCENIRPEIRFVQTSKEVQYDPLSSYRGPVDTVHLATDQLGVQSFKEFMDMCVKPSQIDNEEDSKQDD